MVQRASEHSLHETKACPMWGCFETIDADVRHKDICSRAAYVAGQLHAKQWFMQTAGRVERAVLRQSVRARTWWRHMPYGDQAIFVRADLLRCIVAQHSAYPMAPLTMLVIEAQIYTSTVDL